MRILEVEKIAREYGLITPTDPSPIFGEGFACREVAWDEWDGWDE